MPGFWNERLGWLLLLAGLCTAVGLDPWSLSERDPAALPGSVRMAARHAQAVVLAMGFFMLVRRRSNAVEQYRAHHSGREVRRRYPYLIPTLRGYVYIYLVLGSVLVLSGAYGLLRLLWRC